MARRTRLYLPALLIVAAMLMACAAAVLAVSREAEATFPGQNGKIAYVASGANDPESDIYAINVGGGGKTQITHSYNATEFSPSYSPDGKKIAYTVCKKSNDFRGEIYTIDVGGGGKTNLTNTDNVDEYSPSWGSRPQ